MQLTVADPAVDTIDLVLAAWSEALPAAAAAKEAERADQFVAQLTLRLADSQIPLWDDRA